MNVLAINGSPNGNHGNTDFVLQSLLKGMDNAGATTETIYLNKLNIKHCIGCLSCWVKTPGKCIYNDDMAPLLVKRNNADIMIYATPLYAFSMSGLMKDYIDRNLPQVMPFFEVSSAGLTMHPKRFPRATQQKMLLISSCGFPEERHFAPLVQTIKYFAEECNAEYLGEILKPAAWLLQEKSMQEQTAAYCDDLVAAGKQLIMQGKIEAALADKLRQPWASAQEIRAMANHEFHFLLDEKK